jgi:formamidopyrimidine-DNA glycosylase
MPEGPEVKTTTAFLKLYEGKTLTNITVLSGRYTKKPLHNINNPSWRLPRVINSVNCKGKFIYFSLSKDVYFFSTLGMTGIWSNSFSKYSRIKLEFSDESMPLYYNDMRNFGTFKIILTKKELDKKLKSLGPDILGIDIPLEIFKAQFLKKSEKTIAEQIMNQSVVSGVGNYLKAEILYRAKVSPHRKVSTISDTEWKDILKHSQDIARLSYETGGATIQNYLTPEGKKGLYSQRFAVYNQKTSPCGNQVIKEQTLDKRTTHWVPAVQK